MLDIASRAAGDCTDGPVEDLLHCSARCIGAAVGGRGPRRHPSISGPARSSSCARASTASTRATSPSAREGFTLPRGRRLALGALARACASPPSSSTPGHFGRKRFNDDGAAAHLALSRCCPIRDHTGVNQVFVDYAGLDALRLRAGRQVVRLDNQRWVSDNDFRQMPQLFDGVGRHLHRASPTLAARRATSGGSARHVRQRGDAQAHAAATRRGTRRPATRVSAYACFHDQARQRRLHRASPTTRTASPGAARRGHGAAPARRFELRLHRRGRAAARLRRRRRAHRRAATGALGGGAAPGAGRCATTTS